MSRRDNPYFPTQCNPEYSLHDGVSCFEQTVIEMAKGMLLKSATMSIGELVEHSRNIANTIWDELEKRQP